MPRRKKAIDPAEAKAAAEEAKVAAEKAKAALEQAKAEAKAAAEKAAADAVILANQKELCAYLMVFCLHYHACSIESIFSVLQKYGLKGTEQDIARWIAENKLLTYKEVLPDDEGEQSVFQLDETPRFEINWLHAKHIRLKMPHPQLPPIQSAAQVLTRAPENRWIVTTAAKKVILFDIQCLADDHKYPLEPLMPHFTRCMSRAIGFEFT